MKPQLLLTATLLLSPVAMSAETPTKLEYCTGMSELAEAAMTARQTNVPLHSVLNADGVLNNQLAVGIVKMAYSLPVMHSEKNKLIVTNQFGSKIMMMCLENVEA